MWLEITLDPALDASPYSAYKELDIPPVKLWAQLFCASKDEWGTVFYLLKLPLKIDAFPGLPVFANVEHRKDESTTRLHCSFEDESDGRIVDVDIPVQFKIVEKIDFDL